MVNFIRKIFGGVPAADVTKLLAEGAVVLDVRTKNEFKTGHVKGAVNIPLNQLNSPAKLKQIKAYGKPIVTCCVSGSRSSSAARLLRAKGIDAHNGGPWTTVRGMKRRG